MHNQVLLHEIKLYRAAINSIIMLCTRKHQLSVTILCTESPPIRSHIGSKEYDSKYATRNLSFIHVYT